MVAISWGVARWLAAGPLGRNSPLSPRTAMRVGGWPMAAP